MSFQPDAVKHPTHKTNSPCSESMFTKLPCYYYLVPWVVCVSTGREHLDQWAECMRLWHFTPNQQINWYSGFRY